MAANKVIEKKSVKITCSLCKRVFSDAGRFEAHKAGGKCG